MQPAFTRDGPTKATAQMRQCIRLCFPALVAHPSRLCLPASAGDQPTIASPHEEVRFRGLASLLGGRSPVIATPKEPVAPGPPSLGEGSVGIAAGDPKGGANVVAAAHVASKGIVSSLKVRLHSSNVPMQGGLGGSQRWEQGRYSS
jgi:hypothetical protein